MNPTRRLHELGQSLWLDTITRDMLHSGTLKRYIDELSLTGLTSNPAIFHVAISKSSLYDADIARGRAASRSAEALVFDLALEDIVAAADLFRPVHERTSGIDGWVSLEVAPDLAYDAARTIEAAKSLHARAERPNVYIKIPGTTEGLDAIEASIFAGVPVNVTLLFSREQYLAAADAYLRGIERRIAAGLPAGVASVASLFVSRWDVAVAERLPAHLVNRLGIAVAQSAYRAYRALMDSDRCQRAFNFGARPQRLLMASTGVKDPQARDTLYVEALAAPNTVNTMPESTLLAFEAHGRVEAPMSRTAGSGEIELSQFEAAGVSLGELAERLQREGAAAFVKSWQALLERIAGKESASA